MTLLTMRSRIADQIDGLKEDFKIVDAKKPLRVVPARADLKKAKPLDPAHCVLANALCRSGRQALVYRTVAYVRKSSTTVEKFLIRGDAAAITRAFDQSSSFPLDVPITFATPDAGHSVEGLAQQSGPKKSPKKSAVTSLDPPNGEQKVGARTGKGRHKRLDPDTVAPGGHDQSKPQRKAKTESEKEAARALKRPLS